MSNEILSEVWKNAPTMNASSMLVLLRMADVASAEHRMSWEAVDTIAAKTRQSRRTVQRAMGELRDLDIISDVLEEDMPPAARGFTSSVRWIHPVERWGNVVTGVNLTPPSEPESEAPAGPAGMREVATDSNVVTGDRLTPKPKNYLSTYGRESKNPSDSYRRAGARRAGNATRKQAEESRRAEENALDPAKSPEMLELFPVPETAADGSGRKGSARPGEQSSRPIGPDSSMGLALAFRDALAASEWRAIDLKGMAPLARHIAGWKRDGISPDTIRQMIKVYAGNERFRSADKRKAPWLDFVGKLHLLLSEAQRPVAAAQSDDYWNRLAADQDQTLDESDVVGSPTI